MSENYRYYNRNPDGEETEDCVCRAISTGTGLKYEAVSKLLQMVARAFQCDKLCVGCYKNLLEKILCYKPNECRKTFTVGEVAAMFPHNKVIIRIDGHLTCSVYGVVGDIWNCTDKLVDVYWVVE